MSQISEALGVQEQARAAQRPTRVRMFAALSYRDFRLLWVTTLWWQLGYWVLTLAQGWLVFELTGSTLKLGIVAFASGLPMFVCAPLGGALADRVDRRRILIFAQAAQALIGLCQAVLVAGGWIQVWQIMVLAVLSGTVGPISGPTRQSMALDVSGREHVANAIALNNIAQNSIRVVGPALGGVLIGALGVRGAFFFQTGCFVVATLFTLLIRQPAPRSGQRLPFFQSVAEGFRYCLQDKTVMAILGLSSVATFFGFSYMQLMPAFAKQVLALGATGFGLLTAAPGIGALAGSVYAAWASESGGKGKQVLASQVGLGVSLLLFSFSRSFTLSFLAMVAVGLAGAVWMAMTSTILQVRCKPEFQGRVTALYVLTFGFQTTGSLAAGAIAGPVGIASVVGGFGCVVALLGGMAALTHRGLRQA